MKTFNLQNLTRSSTLYIALVLMLVLATIGFAKADLLTRQLERGMTGGDVSTLQTFLARDITIYPQGLVTGYFGPLTFSAVSNFQSQNGISRVGRVGPITLAAINAQMDGTGGSADTSAPLITALTVTTSNTSANVTWTTNEETSSAFYYSLAPIALTEGLSGNADTVAVSGTPVGTSNAGLRTSHNANVPNLQPNTMYYYVIHAVDQAGNVTVTWPTTFRTN